MRVVGFLVVLADEVCFVGAGYECDVGLEFGIVGGVAVVGEDVEGGDGEVGCVDAVGSVCDEFVGREVLDEGLG